MDKNERHVLYEFLKSGRSTRAIDSLLGNMNTRGWVSWKILKTHRLKDRDKGKLFFYSPSECDRIIRGLGGGRKTPIDRQIEENPPSKLDKYRNTYVLAESEKSFYNILSGETRNLVQGFFVSKKKQTGKCQYASCRNKESELDTVHFEIDRPKIFMDCAKKHRKKIKNGLFRYDVHATMKCFLMSHSGKRSVCFLCKKHHGEFHRVEKAGGKSLRSFRKQIRFDD